MRKSNFSDEQIAYALKQTESGTAINKVCDMLGVSERTFYRWKKRYAGILPDDINRLQKLEIENAKLKKLVAEMLLDKAKMQELLSQNWKRMSSNNKD